MLARTRKLVLLIAGLLAIAAVAFAMLAPRPRNHARVSREQSAVAAMVVILSSQATFHKTGFYGTGALVYADPRHGRGFEDLYQIRHADGRVTHVGLLERRLAEAVDPEHAHGGYYFMDLLRPPPRPDSAKFPEADDSGSPRRRNSVETSGSCDTDVDPSIWFGICAIPFPYAPGFNTLAMDSAGSVFGVDNGGKPLPECFPVE